MGRAIMEADPMPVATAADILAPHLGKFEVLQGLRSIERMLADTATYDYQPDQLRVPKGNGRLSGRWVDSPGALLESLQRAFPTAKEEDGPEGGRALSIRLTPATDADKAAFKEKFGKSIPPSWRDVQIDLNDGADLIARGRDSRGRQTSLYTDAYHDRQAAAKYARIGQVFDRLTEIEDGLSTLDGDPRKAVARLMLTEGIRVGSSDTQRGRVMAYGAATLRKDHATYDPETNSITLSFIAKEGIPATYNLDDPELVEFIKNRLDDPDLPDDGKLFDTNSQKVIDLLREISGLPGIKNHDLRTLLANRIALAEIYKNLPPVPETKREFLALRKKIATLVSDQLRNKPAQAISSYINPAVWTAITPPPLPGA